MKVLFLRFFLVVCLVFAGSSQNVDAVGTSDLKKIISGFVKSGEKYACSEGKFFALPPRITLRSFDGEACKNFREIFYLSRMICQKGKNIDSKLYNEYKGSQCSKKGQSKYGDLTPREAKDQLIEHGIRKGTMATKIILQTSCVAFTAGSLVLQPELAPIFGMACTAAEAAGMF